MMDGGEKGIDIDKAVDVNVSDTDKPEEVSNAVASYEIGVKIGGEVATETDSNFNFVLNLDKDKFTSSNYVVVREHNGQFEELGQTPSATHRQRL